MWRANEVGSIAFIPQYNQIWQLGQIGKKVFPRSTCWGNLENYPGKTQTGRPTGNS